GSQVSQESRLCRSVGLSLVVRVQVLLLSQARFLMHHYFVSPAKVRRSYVVPPGVDLDAVAFVERAGGLAPGTPFFLDAHARPVEPLCSFFFMLSRSLKASTLADYAYDLMDLVGFLASLEWAPDLLTASEEDLIAYREFCTRDRERPVGPATWKR